jgi:fatty-acyl-CoA synthase
MLCIIANPFSSRILRVQPDQKDTPLRDGNGLCILAADKEVGLAVNRINSDGGPVGRFEGYTDSSASQKKIIQSVVVKGDMFFNTGDLLSKDKYGFFYWSDRVGDTFRWKGENVATAEVETILGAIPGIADVAVYGVAIPGCDGRAGMASIQLLDGLTVDTMDWNKYHAECAANLPVYSRPIFLRIRKSMNVTTTFKHQKSDYVKEGFDPALVKDEILYFVSPKDGALQIIDSELFARINSGDIKL